MPLPPLPENNTDRAFLQYSSLMQGHEMVIRFPAPTTQADIISSCAALATALKPLMKTTDSFYGLRHQDAGSHLSFPLAWTSIAGTNSGATGLRAKTSFMSITGRSLGGYRCKLTFFTPYIPDDAEYRDPRGSGNFPDIFLDGIDVMTVKPVAIDSQLVIWNQYGNYGFNSYWQRQQRG